MLKAMRLLSSGVPPVLGTSSPVGETLTEPDDTDTIYEGEEDLAAFTEDDRLENLLLSSMAPLATLIPLHTQQRCVVHSLQSCLRTVLNLPDHSMVRLILRYAADLVRCYQLRLTISDSLRELAGKGLVAPAPTRWNSTSTHCSALCR